MALNTKAWSGGFRRSIGDTSLGATLALVLDSDTKQLHICDAGDAGTDWGLSADSYPSVYIHDIAAPITDYVKIYHDGTNGIVDCDGTTILSMTASGLDIAGDLGIVGDVTVTGAVTWTGGVDAVLTAPTTANDAFYGRIIASGAWTSGNMVGVRGKVELSGANNWVSATGGWFGLTYTTKTGSGSGLTCAINAEVGSNNTVTPNAIVYLQSLPTSTADFSEMPFIAFTETGGGTGSGYLFECGHTAAGTGSYVKTGATGIFNTSTLRIKVNGTAFYLPLSSVTNTFTYAGAVSLNGGAFIFNEAGANLDFRAETANMAYAFYIDGEKDSVLIGSNTDISDVDVRLRVANVAKTLASGQSAALLHVAPAATTTEFTSGTHGYIATAYFSEPLIGHAASGTITTAATVYIADAPTEGDTNNAALFVAAGNTILAGTLYFYDTGGESIASNGSTLTIAGDAIALTGPTTVTGGAFTMGASGSPSGDFVLWPTTALYKVWLDVDGDTNGAWHFGADDYGIDVSCYGQTASASMVWDASEDYLIFAGAGRLEVGTFATPISLDTFTGNEDIHGAMVSSVINAAMTAGEVSRNIWSRMKITADQTANVSIYGACLQCRAHTGSQTVELSAGAYAGAWLYFEASDSDNIFTLSGGTLAAGMATVEASSAQLLTTGSVYGIKINSAVHEDVSVSGLTSFSALYINAGSGKEPWTTGIEIEGDHVVTGITLNAATTGLSITGTYATATSKAINSAITVDVPNYTDGLGANNFDLTTTGVMAGHSAATSSWININGTIASGGVIVAAQTNGIWVNTGGSGNITNAIAVIGMRMSAITTTNASKLTCFSVNVSGDTLDGIFHVAAGENNLGEVANAGTAISFLVPLYINDAGVKKYVKLYDLQ